MSWITSLKDYASNAFSYGAALPLADKEDILKFCRLIKGRGINRLKLKLGKDFNENNAIFGIGYTPLSITITI